MIKYHQKRGRAMSELPRTESTSRQRQINGAFVLLADTLVQDFDLVDLLDRLARICVETLGCDAAGVLIADQRGQLRVMSSSSELMQSLELYEVQNEEGPCLDCFRSGHEVAVTSLESATQRWPRFAVKALDAGFSSVQALPMRLRAETIGALNLFYATPVALSDDDVDVAQALADVATIGILQNRAITRRETLAEQLQTALNSRLAIEQAKGRLAERGSLEVEPAFIVLRDFCRSRNLPLSETARRIVTGELDADVVLGRIP
jgi:transcriptional regulator with GAF, ATPase, and Fis domain